MSLDPSSLSDSGFRLTGGVVREFRLQPLSAAKSGQRRPIGGHDGCSRPRASPLAREKAVSTSLLGAKDEHPLDVPRHGHKSPFAANQVNAAQHELPETHH
jgi:hypothetical protein